MGSGTFIHGIASSQNIDSSGEVIDIAGLDISSLDKNGVLNWSHKNDTPSQVIGKIIKAKKIFTDADCEDEYQKYFWSKCQVPYVYIVGELFDAHDHSTAKDVAAMFRYDAENQGKHESDVLGFSIEGSKIEKQGHVVTRSIARKCTVDVFPCNKMAIAEIVPAEQPKPKDDLDSLFRSETMVDIELFKSEKHTTLLEMLKSQDPHKHAAKLEIEPMKKEDGISMGGASTALSGVGPSSPGSAMLASEKSMQKAAPKLSVVGPQGTKIGTTASGKNIHSHGRVGDYQNMSATDHAEAAGFHQKLSDATKDMTTKKHHADKAMLHNAASKTAALREKARQIRSQALATTPKTSSVTSSPTKQGEKVFHPERSGTMKPPGPIKKALDAGSALAAPSQLSGGAALSKESLDKKMKKSKWLARAEELYNSWEKKEHFEDFMTKRLPHLTKSEIKAIGQTMLLGKSISETYQHSFVVKKENK